MEPVAGSGGPGATRGDPRRTRRPGPGRDGAVVTQQQNGRARLRGAVAVGSRGSGTGVAASLRLVLRPEAQQTEHLPVVLPLDRLAPGTRGGGRLAGARRGAAEKGTELQRPQEEHGPGEAHDAPGSSLLGEDVARREKKRRRGLRSSASGEEEGEARGRVAGSRAKGEWQTLPPAQAVGRGTVLLSPFPVLEGDGERRTTVRESAQCLE